MSMGYSLRSEKRALSRVVGAMVLGIVMVLGTAAGSHGSPLYPEPDPDPFYATPANLADKKPGDVLGVRAMPPLLIFPDTTVTLVRFRSTNSEGKPIAAT